MMPAPRDLHRKHTRGIRELTTFSRLFPLRIELCSMCEVDANDDFQAPALSDHAVVATHFELGTARSLIPPRVEFSPVIRRPTADTAACRIHGFAENVITKSLCTFTVGICSTAEHRYATNCGARVWLVSPTIATISSSSFCESPASCCQTVSLCTTVA